jgi:hypothetical protein
VRVKHRFTRSGRAHGRAMPRFAACLLLRTPRRCAAPLGAADFARGPRETRADGENFALWLGVDMWTTDSAERADEAARTPAISGEIAGVL